MRLLTAIFLGVTLLAAATLSDSTGWAEAAPGNVLSSLTRDVPDRCPGPAGVGVAYQPHNMDMPVSHLWYSCQDPETRTSSNILFTVLSGDSATPRSEWIAVTDGQGHDVPLEALAWDSNEQTLWTVDRILTGPKSGNTGHGTCAVWRGVDGQHTVNIGGQWLILASLAFTFKSGDDCNYPSTQSNFFDGLTVDPATNTLYLSPARGAVIRHFNKDGTPAANDPIDFSALTRGICGGRGCRSSGLLLGRNGHLLSATGTSGKLVEIDPSGPSVVAVYDSGAGRDWGLSCGPAFVLPDRTPVNAIFSADLLSPKLNIIEAPPGICDAPDYGVRNLVVSPREVSAVQGQVVTVSLSGEYIGFGSEIVAAGDVPVRIRVRGEATRSRIVAAPGDLCFEYFTPVSDISHTFPVPCAEGDVGGPPTYPPSIGGQACLDGIDNDGDSLVDGADADCQMTITEADFRGPSTGKFETFHRDVSFLCYYPGEWLIGASVDITRAASDPSSWLETDFSNNSELTYFTFVCTSN